MTKKSGTTTDAVAILHRRYFEGKPERLKVLEEARDDDEIARQIFEPRVGHLCRETLLPRNIDLRSPSCVSTRAPPKP